MGIRKRDNSAGPGWSPCLGPKVSLLSEMQRTIFHPKPGPSNQGCSTLAWVSAGFCNTTHRPGSAFSLSQRPRVKPLDLWPLLWRPFPGIAYSPPSICFSWSWSVLMRILRISLFGHLSSLWLWGNRDRWCGVRNPTQLQQHLLFLFVALTPWCLWHFSCLFGASK